MLEDLVAHLAVEAVQTQVLGGLRWEVLGLRPVDAEAVAAEAAERTRDLHQATAVLEVDRTQNLVQPVADWEPGAPRRFGAGCAARPERTDPKVRSPFARRTRDRFHLCRSRR